MAQRDKKTDFIGDLIESAGGVIQSIVSEVKQVGENVKTTFLAWFDKIFGVPITETLNSILVGISPEVLQKATDLANEVGTLANPFETVGLLTDEALVEKLEDLADQIVPFLGEGGDE